MDGKFVLHVCQARSLILERSDLVMTTARLEEYYVATVRPALMAKFGYSNIYVVPKLEKVVLNMGVGEAVINSGQAEHAADELIRIAGQKAVLTRAKKSIANFKLRAGVAVGAKVTLRRTRMYEFVDRLLNIALPRVRDFRGVSPSSFDGHGNYTLGLKEQIVFPEIDYDRVSQIRGLDIVICTTAKTNEEARVLLGELQMPFTES